MRDADGLSTADGRPALARPPRLPADPPVAVGIVSALHARHRLLPAAWTHTHNTILLGVYDTTLLGVYDTTLLGVYNKTSDKVGLGWRAVEEQV